MNLLAFLTAPEGVTPLGGLKAQVLLESYFNKPLMWRVYDSEEDEDVPGLISRYVTSYAKRPASEIGGSMDYFSQDPVGYIRFERGLTVLGVFYTNGAAFATGKQCWLAYDRKHAETFGFPETTNKEVPWKSRSQLKKD